MSSVEIKNKSDYLTIEIYHERYFFSTECRFHKNKTLEEVIEAEGENLKKVDYGNTPGFYMIDTTSRNSLSQYDYVKSEQIEHISPSCLHIIDLHMISSENDFKEFIWGKTNNKFGLYDIKEDK